MSNFGVSGWEGGFVDPLLLGLAEAIYFGSYTVAETIRVELYVVLAVCLRDIAIDDPV